MATRLLSRLDACEPATHLPVLSSSASRCSRTVLASMAALALLALPAAADVIVIDPLGGDGSALLQSALDHARDDDLLLVRPGTYGSVHTPNHRFTLAADAGGAHIAVAGLTIANLMNGQAIIVRGFDFGGDASNIQIPLIVQDCAGKVRLEDCTAVGHAGFVEPGAGDLASLPGFPGLLATHAADLALSRCTITGGEGVLAAQPASPIATPGGDGVQASDARIAFADCQFTGGRGGSDATGSFPATGGAGLLVKDGSSPCLAFAFGGTLQGGQGGDSALGQGGDGGTGLLCQEPVASVWVRGASVLGGESGSGVSSGTAGAPIVSAATVFTFDTPWGSISLPSPLREDAGTSMQFTGASGDATFVLFSPGSMLLPLSNHDGALFVWTNGIYGPLPVGTIGAGGTLAIPFHVPTLPFFFDNISFTVQAAFVHAGKLNLGGFTYFVWVDNAF